LEGVHGGDMIPDPKLTLGKCRSALM
jgi:hypothetical protein